MLSAAHCNRISKVTFTNDPYVKITGYCNNSGNFVTFGLAQSDHIKQPLLHENGIGTL